MNKDRNIILPSGTWFQPFKKVDYYNTIFKKSDRYWKKEFQILDKLGINTFIFQFGAHDNIAYYNTGLFENKADILDTVLKYIKEKNMDFIMGLYLNSYFYRTNEFKDILERQYEKLVLIFDELFEKLKNFDNLKAWYIPQEIESTIFKEKDKKYILIDFLNKVSRYIRKKSKLPIMISPYFSIDNLSHYEEWWSDLINKIDIDILALQDGIGCYRGIKLNHLDDYFSILKDILKKKDIKFWSTMEIFNFVNAPDLNNKKIKIISAPFERIKKQIEIESKYVEKIIMFEYFHFLSPSYNRHSKKLYKKYKRWIKI